MKRFSVGSKLIAFVAALSTTGLAATEYVVTNDNAFPNTASVYELDTVSGALTELAVLQTGGMGNEQIDQTNIQQAITQNAGCIFVMDPGSGDIASFSKATHYSKVGNYSNDSVAYSGSLALTPDGEFLYASYSGSENIGAWAVNPDCSLSFLAAYVPSFGPAPWAALKVSPNGRYLAVAVVGELFAIDPGTGTLTDLGYIPFSKLQPCVRYGCNPSGVDFTKDSRIAVFGGSVGAEPTAFFAGVTSHGFTSPLGWRLTSAENLVGEVLPFFSAAGYAGSGNLYFGLVGGGGGSRPSAIFTADFIEKPPTIMLTNVTVLTTPRDQIGSIVATGGLMVIPEYPSQIGVYSINPDGSLTPVSTTIDENAVAMFSLSVFPNTR